jgi:hypothetical protein
MFWFRNPKLEEGSNAITFDEEESCRNKSEYIPILAPMSMQIESSFKTLEIKYLVSISANVNHPLCSLLTLFSVTGREFGTTDSTFWTRICLYPSDIGLRNF